MYCLLIQAAGCGGKHNPEAAQRTAPPVVVATAAEQDVPIQARGIGNVEPFRSVAVKSLVSGELLRIYFKEGSAVRAGQLLFQIDPRPFEHQVQQAKAALARDRAAVAQAEAAAARDATTAENAHVEAVRYADLFRSGVVSREQNDQFQTNARSAADAVRADQANIAAAREVLQQDQSRLADAELQLSYTKIIAPVAARAGNLTIKEGNLVQAQSATPLVTINQIRPTYVTFSVPESVLPSVRNYMQRGKVRVLASPPGQYPVYSEGVLDFIDNTVDPTTGTIRMKGLFANKDSRLWPGEFVNVVMILAMQHHAVVVPSAAVQTGQQGKYVFLVDRSLVARQRLVIPGPVIGANTVIQQGVLPGQWVITDGQMSVVPGIRVQITRPVAR